MVVWLLFSVNGSARSAMRVFCYLIVTSLKAILSFDLLNM
jgi:hypothetical protein